MIYMLFTLSLIVLLGPKNQELKLLYEQESVFILFSCKYTTITHTVQVFVKIISCLNEIRTVTYPL
jgi:hypothetical protein